MRSIAFSTISVLLFLFLGPLGFGANRGPREQTPHRPPSGGRVRIQVQTWGSSWDWNQDKGTLPTPVVAAVQRGLYRLDPQGMLEKDLVESENASDDFRTWTFKLKSQVFWSDGAPLTAQHCVDGILRALAPEVSKVPLELENLEGAMAYHLRETPLLPGVRALSERIFEVKLVRPDPLFRIKFLKHQLMPARGDLALTHAKSYGFEPEKMAFLGRMILKDSRPGLRTLMVPNPRHPHPSPISTIELWHVPNLFQARDLFERAHLDVALSPLPRVSSAKILRQSSTDLVALVPISTRAQNRLAMLAVLKATQQKAIAGLRPTLHPLPSELWKLQSMGDLPPLGGDSDDFVKKALPSIPGFSSRAPMLIAQEADESKASGALFKALLDTLSSSLGIPVRPAPLTKADFVLKHWKNLPQSPELYLATVTRDRSWLQWNETAPRDPYRKQAYSEKIMKTLIEEPALIPLGFAFHEIVVKNYVQGTLSPPETGELDLASITYDPQSFPQPRRLSKKEP